MNSWSSSLPTVDTVIDLVQSHYGLEASRVVLVRSFMNDVYRVDVGDRSYALKIYGIDRFSIDEVRWEQRLVRHVLDAGIPVAADVALLSGQTAGLLQAPEGERPFALSEWVPGEKPEPPWTDDLYRNVGATIARFHSAVDTFASAYPRHPVRTGKETREVIEALSDSPERRNLVRSAAAVAEQQLANLVEQGLRWGIRHGDPSLDNLHVSSDGVHLYDFDLAAPGWQVEDLTGAWSTEFGEVFLAGYTAVRPLPPVELAALPWLHVMATIDNLHFHLVGKPAVQGTYSLGEGWVDSGFESLATVADRLGVSR